MVNINISLPKDLHKELKIAAAIANTSLKDLINTTLAKKVRGRKK